MTPLLTPHDAICDEVRRRAQPEAGLLGVFLDTGHHIVLCVEISEGTADVDELFLRHLVAVVADVGVAAVVFAVARWTGRPMRVDRVLWRELSERLAGSATRLLDVVVVGEDCRWSAATGRTWAHPAGQAGSGTLSGSSGPGIGSTGAGGNVSGVSGDSSPGSSGIASPGSIGG
jgi:hypothetical protein